MFLTKKNSILFNKKKKGSQLFISFLLFTIFFFDKQQDFIKKKNRLQDPTKRDTKPYREGGKNDIRYGKRPYKEGRKTTTITTTTNNKNYNNVTITTTNTTTNKPTTTTPYSTKLDQHPEVFKSNHSNQCPEQQWVWILDPSQANH